MPSKSYALNVKPLQFLTEDQVQEIHQASLEILRDTGVVFGSIWALDVLEKAGCVVDRERRRVRFPSELVEECMALCPRTFRCKARNPEHDVILGGNDVLFTHTAGFQTIDLDTFEPHTPTWEEYRQCVTVLDALPSVSHLSCYPYYGYEGLSPNMGMPAGIAMKMRFSSKHQFTCYQKGSEYFTIQMAQACGLETTGTVTATPPLMWADDALTVVKRMIEAGFPLATVDGYTLGATAPVTIAGEVALANAHHMSMIVLVQLLNPGHRISVGHFTSVTHMSTGSPVFGDVSASMSNVVWNQTWRHYGIPCSNGSPGYVCSKVMDYQAGYEKAIGALMSALSGANYILFHLGVSGEMSAHPIQAILDDDVATLVGRIIRGEDVTPNTLALDTIKEIGPVPGHYLDTMHTLQNFRQALVMPKSVDRSTYPDWLQSGRKTALDYARERMEQILAEHKPEPLTPAQEAEIERLLKEAQATLEK
jgi:trimethylamine---corrinoid protein Co-methyltransferase